MSRDPRALLFEELPEALGMTLEGGEDATEFATRLHRSLKGLAHAYPRLLDGIERSLREAFGLDGSAVTARTSLAARASPLAEFAGDGQLGLFVREAASNHPDRDWRETLGRVVQGGLPPTHWSDRDLTVFRLRLQEVAGEFARLEELAAERGNNETNRVLRIGVLDGAYAEYATLSRWTRPVRPKYPSLRCMWTKHCGRTEAEIHPACAWLPSRMLPRACWEAKRKRGVANSED